MPVHLIDDEPIRVTDSDLEGVTDGDPETVYTLRPIGVDDHRRLQKQFTKDVVDRRSHQKVPQTDFEGLNDAVLDFVLIGWSGVLMKGQPAECVLANKLKLDGLRRVALSGLAGMNQIARSPEVRVESFREPA